MSLLTRIKIDPAVCGGLPSVGRYSVAHLLSLLQAGQELEEILAHYEDLWPDDLLAAEAYPAAIQYRGSITVRELVDQARPCFLETMDYELPLVHVCRDLHASGPLNAHLTMRHSRIFRHFEQRAVPLSPDAPVYGQYLTLDWGNHDGFFLLSNYINRDELTEHLAGGGGITNPYTTCLAVLENGQLLPYRTHYTDMHGVRKLLDKRHEEQFPGGWDDLFTELYRDIVVEWLQ